MKRAKFNVPRAVLDDVGKPLPGDERRSIGKGNVPRGTRHGRQTRATAILKDAIIYAAQIVGDEWNITKEDNEGVGGLVSYLCEAARTEPKAFMTLLARVIPLTVTQTAAEEVTYRSSEEVRLELEKRGIIIDRIYK